MEYRREQRNGYTDYFWVLGRLLVGLTVSPYKFEWFGRWQRG